MKYLMILACLVGVLFGAPALAQTFHLAWDRPTEYEDATPLDPGVALTYEVSRSETQAGEQTVLSEDIAETTFELNIADQGMWFHVRAVSVLPGLQASIYWARLSGIIRGGSFSGGTRR